MTQNLKRVIDAKVTIALAISRNKQNIHSIMDIVRDLSGCSNFISILHVLSLGEYFDDGGFRFPSTEECCNSLLFRFRRQFVLRDKFTTKTFADGLYTPGDRLYRVNRKGELIQEMQLDDVCVSSKRRKSKG